MQPYTLQEICQICHQEKVKKRWWYYAHRRASLPITWTLHRLGVAPNVASGLMVVFGLAGDAALVPNQLSINGLGLVLIYLAFLLDKVDGDLARLSQRSSPQAMILDFAYHRMTLFGFYAALGAHGWILSGQVPVLVLGFAAGFLANYVQDAQNYPYRIFAQKVVEAAEPWELGFSAASRRRETRERWVRPLKLFTSQLLLLFIAAGLYLAPWAIAGFLTAAVVCLLILVIVQHCIFLRGGMAAELSYLETLRPQQPVEGTARIATRSAQLTRPRAHVE